MFHKEVEAGQLWDQLAELAWQSFESGGYGVAAAVFVDPGETVALGSNSVEKRSREGDALFGSPLAHAEMNALLSAGDIADASVMFTTLTPCAMCLGATDVVRLRRIEYLAHDPACDSLIPSTGYGGRPRGLTVSHVRDWAALMEILPLIRSLSRRSEGSSLTAAAYQSRNPTMLQTARDVVRSRDVMKSLGQSPRLARARLSSAGVLPTEPPEYFERV